MDYGYITEFVGMVNTTLEIMGRPSVFEPDLWHITGLLDICHVCNNSMDFL